eukprot:409307-Pyramimonas_sp.AAC.1
MADQDLHDVSTAARLGQELGQGGLRAPNPLARHADRVVDAVQLEPHELHLRRDVRLLANYEARV